MKICHAAVVRGPLLPAGEHRPTEHRGGEHGELHRHLHRAHGQLRQETYTAPQTPLRLLLPIHMNSGQLKRHCMGLNQGGSTVSTKIYC